MFGYVRPSVDRLSEAEQQRFQAAYCGLCHTLHRRYGLAARMILNYDLTFLALLLETEPVFGGCCKRCFVHPIKARPCADASTALDVAADDSVILTWWQLRDGVADHGFWKGLKYRVASLFLRRAYRKARAARPVFDESVRCHLQELAVLERENCPSIDRPADTFARLLASAADDIEEPVRRRVLQQMLYHLGRWIYLTDAADDLKKDLRDHNYNPLLQRFSLKNGELTEESRQELVFQHFNLFPHYSVMKNICDAAVKVQKRNKDEVQQAAFELLDFGDCTGIIQSIVYEGLYAVGNSVLNGTFRKRPKREERNPTRKAGP